MQLDEQPRKTAADYRREEAERTKAHALAGAIVNPFDLQHDPTPRGPCRSAPVLRLDGIAARQIKLELSGVLDSEKLHRRQEWEASQGEWRW